MIALQGSCPTIGTGHTAEQQHGSGRGCVYCFAFLKDGVWYISFMVGTLQITDYVRRLVEQFDPEQVVMFGSHAAGTAHADSDVDLLVVMPHSGPAVEQAARIRRDLRAGFPLDIIVRSPAAIQRRLAMGDRFIREILETGKVLHESHGAGVD